MVDSKVFKVFTPQELTQHLIDNYDENKPYVSIYNGPLTETKVLNDISSTFRKSDFFKRFVSKEGFKVNCIRGFWEWHINFNRKSGFMVMTENGNNLELYVYKHKDDLDWEKFILKDYVRSGEYGKFKLMLLIQKTYRDFIQNWGK